MVTILNRGYNRDILLFIHDEEFWLSQKGHFEFTEDLSLLSFIIQFEYMGRFCKDDGVGQNIEIYVFYMELHTDFGEKRVVFDDYTF